MKSSPVPSPLSSPAFTAGREAAFAGGGREVMVDVTVVEPSAPAVSGGDASVRLRVFVADGHPLVLRALREVLGDQPDLILVGEAGTGQALFASAALAQCDVLVVDLSLGRELIGRAHAASPDLVVVAHSILPRAPFESVPLKAGASAFVAKGDHPAVLLEAMRRRPNP